MTHASHEAPKGSHGEHCGDAVANQINDSVAGRQGKRGHHTKQVTGPCRAMQNSNSERASLVMPMGLLRVRFTNIMNMQVFVSRNFSGSAVVFMNMGVAMQYDIS
jgi:hypothetical protein